MKDNLLEVILAAIKSKMIPLATKLKLYTSRTFIRTRLATQIFNFFIRLFDVRPKHEKDYYGIFGFLVSKRLAYAVVVVSSIFAACYLISLHSQYFGSTKEYGIQTYPYDSILLRFADGEVRITGKSGYLAYEGAVADGAVSGFGTLFKPDGAIVYQGNFANNMYEGSGVSYYDNGSIRYQGEFLANLYEGFGKLYRENGSLEYEGTFSYGKKEGSGKLYDNGNRQVYEGDFSKDELVYSSLLGKTTQEFSQAYGGSRILYENTDTFAVLLPDIMALYTGKTDEAALDDSMQIDTVYVLKNSITVGNQDCTTISELKQVFGDVIYEGNSGATLAEAVIIHWMSSRKALLHGSIEMDLTSVYADYYTVESYDADYGLYLYSFRKDGLFYTFVCSDRDLDFAFYFITKEGSE